MMIRGFFRLIGLFLLVIGFLSLVYDGARTIADQTLRITRLGELWNDINQASQQSFQTLVEGVSPLLWNSVMKLLLNQPAWAVLGILGILLMLLFRPSKPLIGYSRNSIRSTMAIAPSNTTCGYLTSPTTACTRPRPT